jgi:hypothetical protein
MRTAIAVAVAVVAALLLGACAEEPQRLASAEKPGYRTDAWPDQSRQRTLRQDEARRIYQ